MELLYILHQRSYRETSYILDALSEQHGRVSIIARGAKRATSPLNHLLQPFRLLLVDWVEKGDLYPLRHAELVPEQTHFLQGRQLLTGFYLNELLINLLHPHDPCPEIFNIYREVLQSDFQEKDLRLFEFNLLNQLGYGLNITEDTAGNAIKEEAFYAYHPEVGCSVVNMDAPFSEPVTFKGSHLLAMAAQNFSDSAVLKDAKRLMRLKLQYLLNGKKLKSRELFI